MKCLTRIQAPYPSHSSDSKMLRDGGLPSIGRSVRCGRPDALFRRVLLSVVALAALVGLTSCGGGFFGDGPILPTFNSYTAVAVADLNVDGKLDLAVSYSVMSGGPPHPGKVAVYLQDPARPGSFLSPVSYSTGNDPVAVAVADLDGDGKPDIVTANTIMNTYGIGASTVSVLLQNPASPGRFLQARDYATGSSPVDVAIGDLNGDGIPDLAVADTTGISILQQNVSARGQFLPLKTITVADWGTNGVAIADFNGDGLADLAATTSGVNVYLQNPAAPGTFLNQASYSVGAAPYWLVASDLNADGLPDIAVANLGKYDGSIPSSVSVLLQNAASPAAFQVDANYASDIRSWTIAAADLDGDGRVDLVSGNMGSFDGGSVSVFLQNSARAGKFQPAVNYADEGPVGGIAIGDVNGDGKADLVLASLDVEIRLQDAAHPGTFLPPTILPSP